MASIHTGSFVTGVSVQGARADIHAGQREELGPYHPLNTFRSELCRRRLKTAFGFSTVVELETDRTTGGFSFDISRASCGGAAVVTGICLDGDINIEKLTMSLASATDKTLVEYDGEAVSLATSANGGELLFPFSEANGFLFTPLLGEWALRVCIHGTGEPRVYARITYPSDQAFSPLVAEFGQSGCLPRIVRSSYEVPIVGERFAVTEKPTRVDAGDSIYGIAFDNTEAKVSAWFESEEFAVASGCSKIFLFKDIPIRVLCGGAGVWFNRVNNKRHDGMLRSTFGTSEASFHVSATRPTTARVIRLKLCEFSPEAGFRWHA